MPVLLPPRSTSITIQYYAFIPFHIWIRIWVNCEREMIKIESPSVIIAQRNVFSTFNSLNACKQPRTHCLIAIFGNRSVCSVRRTLRHPSLDRINADDRQKSINICFRVRICNWSLAIWPTNSANDSNKRVCNYEFQGFAATIFVNFIRIFYIVCR